MSSGQLDEWAAYYGMEPWGLEALDYLLAHFKALFINANLMKGKRKYKTEKLLMFFGKRQHEMSGDELAEDDDL